MMVKGMKSGRIMFHTRCTISLLECIEQLYILVSPGQSISNLAVFLSRRFKETNPEIKIQVHLNNYILASMHISIMYVD